MNRTAFLRTWFFQIRGPFLILSVVLVMIGMAAAGFEGFRHPVHTVLLFVGVILAHASVNLFNELSDHRTGIDARTSRTPFSGGSGLLQAGATSSRQVAFAAYGTLGIAAAVGTYFVFTRGVIILVFMVLGGVSIRYYSSFFARWVLGELVAGLCLGSLVVLGSYTVLTGTFSPGLVLVSVPPGLLTTLLLFLNEFPDSEPDRRGGRRHLVITLGKKKSARVYCIVLLIVYVSIIGASMVETVPGAVLLALLSFPLALRTALIVLQHHGDIERLNPALGMNVVIVLLTDLLLAVGYWIA